MELKLNKQPLYISEMLVDTTVEQPVECDALLPDYCPDIVRILKCMVTPTVGGHRLNGQRLEIEGVVAIVVFYTSATEGVQKTEYKVPFSKAIDLRSEPQKHAMSVQARPGYINCRAVNSRRLDIRGAVTLSVFAMGCREEQVVCGGEGMGIQLREEPFCGSRLLGQESREIRVSETLELTYGKPAIRDIVRCCATPRLVECRAADGKAVIKGELAVHLFYQHSAGCDQMDFTLPTAVVVEMEGIDEHCTLSVNQELAFCTCEPAADRDGEYRAVMLEAGITVTVKAECSYKAVTCNDCYSTKCGCSFRTKTYSTMNLESCIHEPVTIRETMQLPDNIESVLDLWCDVANVTYRSEQGGLVADGRIAVSMLGRMRDGEIYYFDKNLELSERMPVVAQSPAVEGKLAVVGSGYSFTANDSIEVRCDLQLDCNVYSTQRQNGIEEITLDEKKQKCDVAAPGLYLYLVSENEPVWDIAKRYNTSVQRIMEENPQPDGKRGDVLIIPVL